MVHPTTAGNLPKSKRLSSSKQKITETKDSDRYVSSSSHHSHCTAIAALQGHPTAIANRRLKFHQNQSFPSSAWRNYRSPHYHSPGQTLQHAKLQMEHEASTCKHQIQTKHVALLPTVCSFCIFRAPLRTSISHLMSFTLEHMLSKPAWAWRGANSESPKPTFWAIEKCREQNQINFIQFSHDFTCIMNDWYTHQFNIHPGRSKHLAWLQETAECHASLTSCEIKAVVKDRLPNVGSWR